MGGAPVLLGLASRGWGPSVSKLISQCEVLIGATKEESGEMCVTGVSPTVSLVIQDAGRHREEHSRHREERAEGRPKGGHVAGTR